MSPTVAFATLGCRLNQVDTRDLQARLERDGFRAVDETEGADVVVVNTCTVTARAELSDRQAIRRARRASPQARVVVTGCWAQTSPAAVAALGGVDLVVGNADKHRLPALIAEILAAPRAPVRTVVGDLAAARFEPPAPPGAPGPRARAFLKAQDGCRHRCAFCVVPLARGASRSLEPGLVLEHARRLVAAGHPELTLTGVDLGAYGTDLVPRTTLGALVRAVAAVPGLRWLRLSSLLPAYFTDELFDALTASPAVVPHFHVPLQSGSERVLRAMRRPYSLAAYTAVVERLATAYQMPALGADVIVGFPGETDADFAATQALVERLPLSYLHVFPYSERAGTEAAALTPRVPASVVTLRAAALRGLGEAKAASFRAARAGRIEDALVLERRARDGRLAGLTARYVDVAFDGPATLMRSIVRVRTIGAAGDAELVTGGAAAPPEAAA